MCKDKREFEVWTTGLQVSVTTPTPHLCQTVPPSPSPPCNVLLQALLNGFDDTAAVTEFLSQQRTRSLGEDRIKVALGTLRTRVLVQESELTTSHCDIVA